MSRNLAFYDETGKLIEFPIQTPTKLTYEVMNAETDKQKLKLIDDAMKSWRWTRSKRIEILKEIETNLKQYKIGVI